MSDEQRPSEDEVSGADAPEADAPEADAPEPDAPEAEAEAPAADAAPKPAADAPAPEAPAPEAPAADAAAAPQAPAPSDPAQAAPEAAAADAKPAKGRPTPLALVGSVLGSYGLCVVILFFLFLLTYLGTIEQQKTGLYDVQKRYFESAFLVHHLSFFKLFTIPVPLPGVYLLLALLAVNLVVGGLIRIQKTRRTAGIIIVHIGMLFLVAAGFVKQEFADDGHLTLYEGDQSSDFVSYHLWEVAIWDADQTSDVKEYLIPDADFTRLGDEHQTTFTHPELPFQLQLSRWSPNCEVRPKGPMWEAASPVVDGFALLRFAKEKEHEANAGGIYCEVKEGERVTPGLLWGGRTTLFPPPPLVVRAGGKRWAIDLRRKRYAMPFTIRLDDFVHEFHPGTNMAKFYKSNVTKVEGGTSSQVLIEMNTPLRHGGYVIFQSTFGPPNAPPGARLFSGFSVVRNPSDQWPLYACIVVSIGLLLAFGEKLLGYIRSQAPKRKAA